MENLITNEGISYKDIEDYKIDVNKTIETIIHEKDKLVFANVARKVGVNEFVIREFPQLRKFILERILYYKKIKVINDKIDRIVNNLIKAKKNVTFVGVMNRCKFTDDMYEEQAYIKDKIRKAVVNNSHKFK